VMNEILGGGFSSRLFKNIRTKQGLAYAVGGGIGSSWDHPGIFRLAMGTKIETTSQAIESLNEQIAGLIKEPPTQDELKLAKDSILNSFIFNFDSPDKVLRERMAYEFYGYPADFLEQYRAGVEKVTIADVARVAQKYVHPGTFSTLVVGTKAAGEQLAKLGPVTQVDIAIPEPGGEQQSSQAPKQTTPEAKAVMGKVVDAMGGEAKMQSVNAIRRTVTSTIKTPQGEMTVKAQSTVVFPDREHTVLNTPMGEMTIVYTPEASFMMMGGQTQDAPSSRTKEGLNAIRRDLISLAQHVNDPKYSFTVAGEEKIGGVQAKVVEINAEGYPLKLYVDPQTGHVLRETFSAAMPTGPGQMVTEFSDWQAADGITLPMQSVTTANGQQISSEKVETREFNPKVDPKLFEKAAAAPAS